MPILSDHYLKKTVIPAVFEKGEIKCFYGKGPLPRMVEGALLEIHVNSYALMDVGQDRVLSEEHTEVFLPEGQTLMVRLSLERIEDPKANGLHELQVDFGPGYPCRFAEVRLEEDLKIHLHATKHASLWPAKCSLPALEGGTAKSLNHAYTLLSRHFETKRITHGGNVFEAFYVCRDGRWRQLKGLRKVVAECFEAKIEGKLKELNDQQKKLNRW